MTDYNAILKRMRDHGYTSFDSSGEHWSTHADFNSAIKVLDEWAAAHPVKTYAQDFFEKFPNAVKKEDGDPRSCWACIYSIEWTCPLVNNERCHDCHICWNRPMPDAQQDC